MTPPKEMIFQKKKKRHGQIETQIKKNPLASQIFEPCKIKTHCVGKLLLL